MTSRLRSYFKYLLLASTLFVTWGYAHLSTAQDTADTVFNDGMQLYRKAQFEEAAKKFSRLQSPEAFLFAGKSYFSAGSYLKSQYYLTKIAPEAPRHIRLEGQYTHALVAFQLSRYRKTAKLLHSVINSEQANRNLIKSAQDFYTSFLPYLTSNQRKEIFMSSPSPQLRLDIMESMIGNVDHNTLFTIFNTFRSYLPDSSAAPLQYDRIVTALSDSLLYESKYTEKRFADRVPDGISYDIGVALPLFKPERPEFNVSRGLYNGILLAAEEYNQQHSDKKVFIRFRNTDQASNGSEAVFNQLVWKHPIDAMIGPLFSKSAYKMANLAEQYQITMLTPLANSDTLNLDNPYVFQVNPTFSVRGRKMARFAVNKLGLDTMAVIAQKNALGYESAFSFRETAERMGAKIAYFLVEDFAATAYDLSEQTKYLTADKEARDSLNIQKVDAIYAPFTGQAAHTLIDLLMTDLEAANSDVILLGSAEWGAYEMDEKRRKKFDMYYPEADPFSADTGQYNQFDGNYKSRFGISPTKFSYIGYDTAEFLLETLDEVGNPAYLKEGIKQKAIFRGLTGPVHFRGKHINQEIEIKKKDQESSTPDPTQ